MTNHIDIAAIAAKAAQTGQDMTKVQKGGGEYTPPAAGMCRLRLVGYFEIGKQKNDYKGVVTYKDKVQLVFELSGPKHQPKVLEDGTKIPQRITITETLSLNEKAHFYKIFSAMNYEGAATHMAQLLGKDFIGTVIHKQSKDGQRTYAVLRDQNGYTIRRPFVTHPETGDEIRVNADPAITQLKLFIWNLADKAMWDSIFIEGSYDERKDEKTGVVTPGKSKNVIQNTIKQAQNWPGSPAQLVAGGDVLDLPEPEATERDPLDEQASVEHRAGASYDPLDDDIPF